MSGHFFRELERLKTSLLTLCALVEEQARDAVRALLHRNAAVNAMKQEIRLGAEQQIRDHPHHVAPLMRVVGVARNLERIADCATNIAEDVVFLVEGAIIRHAASAPLAVA